MSISNLQTIKRASLFLCSLILIILIVSFPIFSPLIFVVFSIVFELIRNKKPAEQFLVLISLIFLVTLIVFFNPFFIKIYRLLLLAALYFAVLLATDFIIAFQLTKYNWSLLYIFLYIIFSRIVLSFSSSIFPFYWTLTMQLLPFMNITSRFLVPVFFEGICIVIAVVVYFFYTKKIQKYMYFQVVLIIVISIVFSFIIKTNFVPKKQQTSLECTIIQGGYSSQDYTLIETYPVLTEKLANRYLMHLEEVKNAKFIILPESAFPVKQKQDSSILQSIKGIACSRNEYILTSILLEEGMEVYNAAALINPQGQLQDVYKKRNVVLFVETSDFAKGKALPIFEIGNTKIAPMICFDVVFIRNYFRVKIPDVYIVTSNDIFAERTVLAQLHQSYAVINSRTMGIPLLQVMQNGPSFYVNSKGALTNLTKPYEKVIGLPVLIQ